VALCPECGEALRDRGYCTVCDDYWLLPEGAACPKHDLPLERGRPEAGVDLPPGARVDWATIGRFAHPTDAEAPRIRLEAEGIPTFVEGERMGGHGLYQVATGGVKLQVPRDLAQEARVLLSQSWAAPEAEDDLDDAWEELAPTPGSMRRRVMKGVIIFLFTWPLLAYAVAAVVSWLAGR
jgi:hypothetical protein